MAATVIEELKNNVRDLSEIDNSKEVLAHDVKKTALNFIKSSHKLSAEEVKRISNLLNTHSKQSLISMIFGMTVSNKVQQNDDKEKFEHKDSNKVTSDKASLIQKIQELRPTTYITEEAQSRSSRS